MKLLSSRFKILRTLSKKNLANTLRVFEPTLCVVFNMSTSSVPETAITPCDQDIQKFVEENVEETHSMVTESNLNTDTTNCNEGNLSKRALKKLKRKEKWKEERRLRNTLKKANAPEPGYDACLYEETDYYIENGLRKVYPYYYKFSTYTKERWIGRTLMDMFTSEFTLRPEENYRDAITEGKITVNGQRTTGDYVLKNNDLIENIVHRHESSVKAGAIEVLVNNKDLIVVNKPSSIPCHPCGPYRHNSLVFIIGRQLGCANLRNIYRLDRLTSGVLILGKTTEKTKELEDQIMKRQVRKEYVSRVVGEFPDGIIECKEPMGVMSNKCGLWVVKPDGKPCHTTFQKLSFNGKSSVVRCMPHTGRTHQIRVHLQFLGHPIINDPFYNSDAFGPNKGKGGVMDRTPKEISDSLLELTTEGNWLDQENPLFDERMRELRDLKEPSGHQEPLETTQQPKGDSIPPAIDSEQVLGKDRENCFTSEEATTDPSVTRGKESADECPHHKTANRCDVSEPSAKKPRVQEDVQGDPLPFDRSRWIPDPECRYCRRTYRDPKPEQLVMYLHALSYKGPDWEYSTDLPEWAQESWTSS